MTTTAAWKTHYDVDMATWWYISSVWVCSAVCVCLGVCLFVYACVDVTIVTVGWYALKTHSQFVPMPQQHLFHWWKQWQRHSVPNEKMRYLQ